MVGTNVPRRIQQLVWLLIRILQQNFSTIRFDYNPRGICRLLVDPTTVPFHQILEMIYRAFEHILLNDRTRYRAP